QEVSEPGAVATGSTSAVEVKERTFASRSRFDPVATAPGSDTGEGALRATKPTGITERISEANAANDLKRLVGGGNVTRLSETSFADSYQSKISERALIVSPGTAVE